MGRRLRGRGKTHGSGRPSLLETLQQKLHAIWPDCGISRDLAAKAKTGMTGERTCCGSITVLQPSVTVSAPTGPPLTEPTALFLASLSHGSSPVPLLASLGCALVLYRLGTLRSRLHSGAPAARVVTLAHALACLLLATSVAMLVVSLLHLGCAGLVEHRGRCQSHLRLLAAGLLMYAEDNDQRFPPGPWWAEGVAPLIRSEDGPAWSPPDAPLRCPGAATPASYGMNARLGAVSLAEIASPAETVQLFDADAPFRSFTGGAPAVAWHRHAGRPNLAYADGHVRSAAPSLTRRTLWSPRE